MWSRYEDYAAGEDPEERLLPDQLKQLLDQTSRKIFEILGPFFDAIRAEPPPATIYHYTDDVGLKGILRNGVLWQTDIFNLNDPSELRHGIQFARDALRQHQGGDRITNAEFARMFEAFVGDGLENIAHFFVTSFSRQGDDLAQWRAYAKDGRGYAIGFDAHALEQAFAKSSAATRWGCSIFPAMYCDKQLLELHRGIAAVVMPHVHGLRGMGLTPENAWVLVKGFAMRVAVSCLSISAIFKHPGYKGEEEYRFLQLHQVDDQLGAIKRRGPPKRPIRYMEFRWKQLACGALKEVIVGPAADLASAKQFAGDCLEDFPPGRYSH